MCLPGAELSLEASNPGKITTSKARLSETVASVWLVADGTLEYSRCQPCAIPNPGLHDHNPWEWELIQEACGSSTSEAHGGK